MRQVTIYLEDELEEKMSAICIKEQNGKKNKNPLSHRERARERE
jgi:hypothetical protein